MFPALLARPTGRRALARPAGAATRREAKQVRILVRVPAHNIPPPQRPRAIKLSSLHILHRAEHKQRHRALFCDRPIERLIMVFNRKFVEHLRLIRNRASKGAPIFA